jgi:hypothetical protein
VASAIASGDIEVPAALVGKVGTLLITTLTSLKHAGAAFAARDSLQAIATFCLSSEEDSALRMLPYMWIDRLLDEISTNEKVRDSTLRRSTGYALGFVALMRSEVASHITPRTICPRVLQNIMMYSLPPEQQIAESFAKLDLCDKDSFNASDFFNARSAASLKAFVFGGNHEVGWRNNALTLLVICMIPDFFAL